MFNLVSRANETWHRDLYETCQCKCRQDPSVCSNKQHWNEDKCKCKKLIDKGRRDKGFIWNPSNYECEYDKPCDVRVYRDYEDFKCRKKLFDELIEEYSESINENEIISVNLNDYGSVCGSCTVCIVLFVIAFLMMIGISSAFIYFYWYLKKSNTVVININPGTETVIY